VTARDDRAKNEIVEENRDFYSHSSGYRAIPHANERRIIRTRLSSLSVENRICDRRSYINGLLLINASGRRPNNTSQTGAAIEFRRIE
jgi:hypothetical protein